MPHCALQRPIAATLAVAACQALPAAAQSQPYVGQIMCAAFNFAPLGWAELNGQQMSISRNTALFSLLGVTYGGDGITTFNLPDMRGRLLLHTGEGPGLTARTEGDADGSEAHVLTPANLPPHAHSLAAPGSLNDANSVSPGGKVPASKPRTNLYTDPTNLVAQAPASTGLTGQAAPVAQMPPFLTVKCFISLAGQFPPRP
ncbi:phage tail protein [Massilia sp. PWRC2]|uniref:phage tail protein n=1 Tax=Massilia sp. PWRC2 TaxID=2804626 RepID=UPI003CF08305